jgi:hypothetical protein
MVCFLLHALSIRRVDNGKPNTYILTGSFLGTSPDPPAVGTPEFINAEYYLPAGFTCTRCVLQMEYFTYNSCVEPCPRAECDFYADRLNKILPLKDWGPKDYCPAAGGGGEVFRWVTVMHALYAPLLKGKGCDCGSTLQLLIILVVLVKGHCQLAFWGAYA